MNATRFMSHDVKQDTQDENEEEEGEIVFESRNFLNTNQGGCGTEFQYFNASAHAKNITLTNAFETNDIKRPCFNENINGLYPYHSLYKNNHLLSFSKHSFLPLPTLENYCLSPTNTGDMSTGVPCGNETDFNKNILEETTLYRNSMCVHFISVWIVLKEFDFLIILNAVKKATFFFTVKSINHRHHGRFFIFYFESNLDAHLAIQALTHLTFEFLNTTNGYNRKPFIFSRINQVTPLTFHLVPPFDKTLNRGDESLVLPHLQNGDSYNGYDGIYCSKGDETKAELTMESNTGTTFTCSPCEPERKSDGSLKEDSSDGILDQGSCGFNDKEQNTSLDTFPLSYHHFIDSITNGYGSSEEDYKTLKYFLPRCLTNPILKDFYFSLVSKKHHVHFPTSYWCEHATFDVQMKDYEYLLNQYSLKNRYLLFKNLPNKLSTANELKIYFMSKGLELQKFQMEIVYQTSNTVTAHVAFKTKKEAYEAQRLVMNHVTGNDMTVEFSGPRSASHTLWIGNLTNVACEWIVSKGFNDLLRSFQGLSRLRVLPEKNCAFATFETKQQAVFVRNFCHGLLFGYLGNKVRLNVDFTVAVNEVEQIPVPNNVCEFCRWRNATIEDTSVKKPFITVPPHLEFFLHDPLHMLCVEKKNSKLDMETTVASQSLEVSHSSLVSLESGSSAIEATGNTNVTLQENKTIHVNNESIEVVHVMDEGIETQMSTNKAAENVKNTAQSRKHVTVTKVEGEREQGAQPRKEKALNKNEEKTSRHITNKVRKGLKEEELKKNYNEVNEKAKINKEIYEGLNNSKANHKGLQNFKEINEKFINARTKNEQGENLKQINKGLKCSMELNKQKRSLKEGMEQGKSVHVPIEKLENANVLNYDNKGGNPKSIENQYLSRRKVKEDNVDVMSERKENKNITTQNKDNVKFRNPTVEVENAMKKGTENVTEFKATKESGRDGIEKKNSSLETQKRKMFQCQNTKEKKKEEKENGLSAAGLPCRLMEISKSGFEMKTLESTCLDKDDKIQSEQVEETIQSVQHPQKSEESTKQWEKMCSEIKEPFSKCSSVKKKLLSSVVGKDGFTASSKKTTDVKQLSTECVFLEDSNDVTVGRKHQNNLFLKTLDSKKLLTIKGINTKKLPMSKVKRAVSFSGTKIIGTERIASYNSNEMTNIRHCMSLKSDKESITSRKPQKIPSCTKTLNKSSWKNNKDYGPVLKKKTFQNKTNFLLKKKVIKPNEMSTHTTAHDIVASQNIQSQKKRPIPSEEKGCVINRQDNKGGLLLHSTFLPDENDTISIPKLKKKIACRDSMKNIPSQTILPRIQGLAPPLKEPPTRNVDQDEKVCEKSSSSPVVKKDSMEIEEMLPVNNNMCNVHKVGKQASCTESDKEMKKIVSEIESVLLERNRKEESEGDMGNPVIQNSVFEKKNIPNLPRNNLLKRQLLLDKPVHLKQKNGLKKKKERITNSVQQKSVKRNTIALLNEEMKQEVQQNNVSSIVKGTCQLMKQGQFVCLVNYQFKQGKIDQTLPTILDVSARTTITILHERVQQKCNELTIWQLLPLEDATPYETLCEYFKSRNRIGLVESCKKTIFLVPLKDSSEILNLQVNKMTLFAVVIHGCLLKPKGNS